jgi:N-ethylmaleimide reductase
MHPFEREDETWLALAAELSKRKLAYVHLSAQATLGEHGILGGFVEQYRRAYSGKPARARLSDLVTAHQTGWVGI